MGASLSDKMEGSIIRYCLCLYFGEKICKSEYLYTHSSKLSDIMYDNGIIKPVISGVFYGAVNCK